MFSREQILEALRKAYELRNPSMSMYSVSETIPLTGPFYDEMRNAGSVYGPHRMRVLQIFGTWKSACEEAGVGADLDRLADHGGPTFDHRLHAPLPWLGHNQAFGREANDGALDFRCQGATVVGVVQLHIVDRYAGPCQCIREVAHR